jgi:hypothetical protein
MAKDSNSAPKQKTLTSFFSKAKETDASSDAEYLSENDSRGEEDDEYSVNDDIEEEATLSKSKKSSKPKAVGRKGKREKKKIDDEGSDNDASTNKQSAKEIAYHLPPMHDLPTIFSDLVSHVPQIVKVAERLKGRKLRVATMCSGTESPLLALNLARRCILEKYGISFDVEHVFSCEIEPFKQAYIERNFHPPLLFRDVCELGDGEAYV